jgi:hypothetical protein
VNELEIELFRNCGAVGIETAEAAKRIGPGDFARYLVVLLASQVSHLLGLRKEGLALPYSLKLSAVISGFDNDGAEPPVSPGVAPHRKNGNAPLAHCAATFRGFLNRTRSRHGILTGSRKAFQNRPNNRREPRQHFAGTFRDESLKRAFDRVYQCLLGLPEFEFTIQDD